MHGGSDFGFSRAEHSVPASHSLHTNHFLYLSKGEEAKGAQKDFKEGMEANNAADEGWQKGEVWKVLVTVIEVVSYQSCLDLVEAHIDDPSWVIVLLLV